MKNDETNEFGLPYAVRYICHNVLGSQRMANRIKKRNLVEGLLLGAVIAYGISFIPFKIQVKIFSMVVFGITFFILGCIGISNRSITEYIYARVRFNTMPKKYHKRSIKYVRKTTGTTNDNGEQLTYAETIFYSLKKSYELKKENGEKFSYTNIIDAFKSIQK